TIIKYVILVLFTSQVAFGINGTALALAVTAILTTLLHYGSLKKLIGYDFGLVNMIKMLCLVCLTYFFGKGLMSLLPNYQVYFSSLSLIIALLCVIYLIFVFGLKIITFEELKPLFKKR
ncbi:MAG: stage V sporulation protein B, partial [Amphibacillus sp.]|nr:stage V sporulation protein B [Amphibacillus sp.]